MSKRIVIACGGTGGHLFPGIAVAEAAHTRGWECLLLISEKQIDALATEGHQDLKFEKVPAVAMPRLLSFGIFKFGWRMWKTVRACRRLLQDFKADAVLGMGGFTSLPPVFAGRRLGLRTFVHESNAVPGKANRITAKFCTGVLLGLADCARHFPGRNTLVTGTPLRTALLHPVDPPEARAFFSLRQDRRTLLIMGGSQGARGINRAVCDALPLLDPDRYQVIHLTGPGEIQAVRQAYSAHPGLTAHVAPFCQRMELAYALADLALSRSGASSLTELSAFGVPTMLVPYPAAADDHQRRNAEVFTRVGAAVAVEESTLTGASLAALFTSLLEDSVQLRALSDAMKALAPREAADKVCDSIAGA